MLLTQLAFDRLLLSPAIAAIDFQLVELFKQLVYAFSARLTRLCRLPTLVRLRG